MSRKSFFLQHIDLDTDNILEIGALDSPTFTKDLCNIKYLDYASKEELHNKSPNNPRYSLEKLVDVDYICPNPHAYSNSINDKFDVIIANHVIEHITDIISWFNELSKLLTVNGKIFLSIPDKNYTFDYIRRDTDLFQVIQNYKDKVRKPTFLNIVEHMYYHKSVSAKDIWLNQHVNKIKQDRYSLKSAIEVAEHHSNLDYADVHVHVFTMKSFNELLLNLINLAYIDLKIISSSPVEYMKNEFYVILSK